MYLIVRFCHVSNTIKLFNLYTVEDGKEYTIGLLEFAENFLKKVGRYPASPMLWDFIKLSWKMHNSLVSQTDITSQHSSLIYFI